MVFVGVGFNWGCVSTGITAGLTGSFNIQSRQYSRKANKFEATDSGGNEVGWNYYNQNETATLEYMPTSASPTGSATVGMPAVGDQITVTDNSFVQIAGTWRVESDASAKSSNKEALLVTVPLKRVPAFS